MMTSNGKQDTIVATLVPDHERLEFLPRHFGTHMLTVESYIYTQFGNLCPAYMGGYWHFYELSNGGCYLAPHGETFPLIHTGNYFDATVSGDVAGIIASLFAFSQLSFHFEQAPFCSVLTNHFHFLRDYAAHHPHAALIYRAID